MALTYSPAPQLGSPCPDFRLPTVDDKTSTRYDFSKSKVLVVMFICNHCPYVKAIEDRLLELAQAYKPEEAAFVAICSNDPTEYPEDAPAELLRRWKEKSYPFPYLIDTTQQVAKAFGAVCTPDIYAFDEQRKLRYRGRLDDAWKDPALVQRRELKAAIDSLLKGQQPAKEQIPSMGCSIKWKE